MGKGNSIHEEETTTLPDIPTGEFLVDAVYEHGPQHGIYAEALDECRARLSELVISDDFDSTNIATVMRQRIEEVGVNSLVQNAAREEMARSYKGKKLLEMFGIEKEEGAFRNRNWQGPLPVFVKPEFEADLLEQVGNLTIDATVIETMHNAYKQTSILGFFQFIRDLKLGEHDQVHDATDMLFELSEEALFNPDFTLPIESDDATYLLCYAPYRTRRMFKQIMTSNQILRRMGAQMGEVETVGDIKMRDALIRIMRGESLTGQTWNDFGAHYGLGEVTGKKIAFYAADIIEAQAEIQSLRDDGKGLRVLDVFEQARIQLIERLERISREDPAGMFKNTDIGHGLNGFRIYSVTWVNDSNMSNYEFTHIPKDGTSALIFEDDEAQANVWRRLVDRYSPHNIEGESLCGTVSDFEEKMVDPNIGLFLVDINNPADEMAGIEIADRLTRLKAEQIKSGQIEPGRLINIIVWSTSPDLVKAASDHFYARIRDHQYDFPETGYALLGSSYRWRQGINLIVKYKDPDLRDFNDLSREPENRF